MGMHQEIIMVIFQEKKTNKHKENFVILQSIRIIVIKIKETRVIRIKFPLEYLQV